MAEPKTRPTDRPPADFLAGLDPKRRADGEQLLALMERVTGEPACLWGTAIVGFGRYVYDGGREWPLVGFSPRKAALTLYVLNGFSGQAELLGRLGEHTTGVGCLYLKRLAHADLEVLEEVVRRSAAAMRARYPEVTDGSEPSTPPPAPPTGR